MASKFPLWLVGLLLLACSSPHQSPEETADFPEDEVWLNEAQLQRIQLQTDSMQFVAVSSSIRVNGMIDVPPQNRALIHPPIAAYITSIRVKIGQSVKKGETLAVLEHPDLLETQRRYLEARAQLAFMESDFNRQEALAQDQATARRQFERAKADLLVARAALSSLEAQLARLGIHGKQLQADSLHTQIQLKAGFDGFISSVDAQLGQFVSPDRPILGMLNKEHLHVELEVFERDLASVFHGQRLSFELTNMPGKSFTGNVFLISQQLDLQKRSVNVHGHIDQEDDPILRPGMFVSADLHTNEGEFYTLPEAALIRSENSFFAWQQLSPTKFKRMPMSATRLSEGRAAFESLDAPSARWVTQGAHRLEAAWQARFAVDED
ncbi:MAG: efflux RND transporter periplasmic adaptor subunit [Bacteroidia bacterium]